MTEPKSLPALTRWFREEWQAEMGSGRIHVRDTDAGGSPEFHARFLDLINLARDPAGRLDRAEEKRLKSFPIRWNLRQMARASMRGRRRAMYLYRLTLTDYDPHETARRTTRLAVAMDEHGRDWIEDYATLTLQKLWDRCQDPRTHDTDGKPRTFVQRRISKSEAQSAAEAAA